MLLEAIPSSFKEPENSWPVDTPVDLGDGIVERCNQAQQFGDSRLANQIAVLHQIQAVGHDTMRLKDLRNSTDGLAISEDTVSCALASSAMNVGLPTWDCDAGIGCYRLYNNGFLFLCCIVSPSTLQMCKILGHEVGHLTECSCLMAETARLCRHLCKPD